MLGRVESNCELRCDGATDTGFVACAHGAEYQRLVRSSLAIGLWTVSSGDIETANRTNRFEPPLSTRKLHRYVARLRLKRKNAKDTNPQR